MLSAVYRRRHSDWRRSPRFERTSSYNGLVAQQPCCGRHATRQGGVGSPGKRTATRVAGAPTAVATAPTSVVASQSLVVVMQTVVIVMQTLVTITPTLVAR